MKLDKFTEAYIDCALWSENDESTPEGGVPFDDNYTQDDIDDDTLRTIIADCERFQKENLLDITDENCLLIKSCLAEEMAGHDFWLTRSRHSTGFWDGCWKEEAGERLTKASEAFDKFHLYLGDDGKIHGSRFDNSGTVCYT